MRVIRQRLLRGANMYSRFPCLAATISLEDAVVPLETAANAVAQQLSSPLSAAFAPGSAGAVGADVGRLVALAALELQRSCGHVLDFVHAESVPRQPTQHRVVVQYTLEHVAQRALVTALEMVGAALRGDDYDAAPAIAGLHALSASLALPPAISELVRQARERGIPVLRASEHADLMQFGWGSRQWRFVDAAVVDGAVADAAVANYAVADAAVADRAVADSADTRLLTNTIVRDRLLTRALMVEGNIDVPPGTTVTRLEDALRVGRRFDWDVVVKRRHVVGDDRQWRCTDEAQLTAAFALVRAAGDEVVLESFEDGALTTVQVGPDGARHASTAVRHLCANAAAKLGLAEAQMSVVETKAGPLLTAISGIGIGAAGATGGADEVRAPGAATRAQRMLAEPGQGRIPLIAVTGTNGKTTATLMIAHAVRLAGLRTGYTTTQGIFIGDQRVGQGDCTGYWSHRMVLSAPQVDFAVLETARGGLLKRGLAFDSCSVGVMLNVSDDHLGMDGVETVEDLARVKSTVIEVSRTAVLNADDRHCVAAAKRLRSDARAIFFSMDADNPVLRTHLARGGCGVWLENEAIMLSDGDGMDSEKVIDAAAIPATVGALARYNIANSLAATAALYGAGFGTIHIGKALSSFVSDAATNPLRSNIFKVSDFHIVLDYAHNPAAYAALGTMARGLANGGAGVETDVSAGGVPHGRVLGVITSPGDRRDVDLRSIGETCAAAFDVLFVYESAARGRPVGEAAAIIGEGVVAAGGPAHIETFSGAAHAVQRAYRLCEAGDVLVFACGTAVSTLIDAVRAIDADGAASIELQLGGKAT